MSSAEKQKCWTKWQFETVSMVTVSVLVGWHDRDEKRTLGEAVQRGFPGATVPYELELFLCRFGLWQKHRFKCVGKREFQILKAKIIFSAQHGFCPHRMMKKESCSFLIELPWGLWTEAFLNGQDFFLEKNFLRLHVRFDKNARFLLSQIFFLCSFRLKIITILSRRADKEDTSGS